MSVPDRIRVLFIGELNSSHFHNWLQLFTPHLNEFVLAGINLGVETTLPSHVSPLYWAYDQTPLPGAQHIPVYSHPNLNDWWGYIPQHQVLTPASLKNTMQIMRDFRPHIIHTLGMFPGSIYFLHLLKCLRPDFVPAWLVQARGGPDIALNRDNPQLAGLISEMLNTCDCFMADNSLNYQYAEDLGLSAEKRAACGSVPGTGGIDYKIFDDVKLPSQKERLIVWPKAYFFIQSDGMPVVRALQMALAQLPDVRLVASAASGEVEYWMRKFLAPYADRMDIHARLPYEDMIALYKRARVLLAPSLSDGIPNSMYEAMASHTVPILSPIETLTPLFVDGKHTIYADNLDPQAICQALLKSMRDDKLADSIAVTNRAWLPELAGKDSVRTRVIKLYHSLAELKDHNEYWQNEFNICKMELRDMVGKLAQSQEDLVSLQKEMAYLQQQYVLLQQQAPIARIKRRIRRLLDYKN